MSVKLPIFGFLVIILAKKLWSTNFNISKILTEFCMGRPCWITSNTNVPVYWNYHFTKSTRISDNNRRIRPCSEFTVTFGSVLSGVLWVPITSNQWHTPATKSDSLFPCANTNLWFVVRMWRNSRRLVWSGGREMKGFRNGRFNMHSFFFLAVQQQRQKSQITTTTTVSNNNNSHK